MLGFGGKRNRLESAGKIVEVYPPGKKIAVYYKPYDPSVSWLRVGITYDICLQLSLGGVLFLAGVFIACLSLRVLLADNLDAVFLESVDHRGYVRSRPVDSLAFGTLTEFVLSLENIRINQTLNPAFLNLDDWHIIFQTPGKHLIDDEYQAVFMNHLFQLCGPVAILYEQIIPNQRSFHQLVIARQNYAVFIERRRDDFIVGNIFIEDDVISAGSQVAGQLAQIVVAYETRFFGA
jgi:hypothetical protein